MTCQPECDPRDANWRAEVMLRRRELVHLVTGWYEEYPGMDEFRALADDAEARDWSIVETWIEPVTR